MHSEKGKWRWKNVPVPEIHVGLLGVGIVVHFGLCWELFPEWWIGHVAGWPILVAGVLLAAWAVKAAGEIDLSKPSSLFTTGPYAFSRNPIFLACTLIYVGIVLILDPTGSLLLLPVTLLVTHLFVVVPEERYLGQKFGEGYRRYKAHVHRYI